MLKDSISEREWPLTSYIVSLVLVLVLWLAITAQPSYAQIILDGPNVSGNIGLNGETFGSGNLYFYWPGGNVQTSLVNGDTDFSMRVEPDQVFNANVSMYSLQGATNANVYQYVSNITGPLSSAEVPLNLDLRRDAGRIIGRVLVDGGSVSQVYITASKSISSNERYDGNARATATPFDAILPFIVTTGVNVQGTATLRADEAAGGCEVPVTLSAQTIDVPLNGNVIAEWHFELAAEQCNQGSIQGQVTIDGLDGENADAVIWRNQVQVSGPVSRYQYTDASGNYAFSDLPPGSYYIYAYTYFNAPYYYIYWPNVGSLSVGAGALLTQNFSHSVGTVHAAILPTGVWDLSVVNSIWSQFNTYSDSGAYLATSYDYSDLATGSIDSVVPAGTTRLAYYRPYFFSNDGVRSTGQYFHHSFSNGNFPFEAIVSEGGRQELGVFQPETSESLVVVQLANAAVGLTSLRLTGTSRVYDANGVQIEYRYIDMTSNANPNVTSENSVAVLVRGVPGTYQMTATGQGDDGGTYSKQFELVLGAPENTPTGTNVESPIIDETGTETGSITFGEVTSTGDTTVSQSESGPQAPDGYGFRVFGAGTKLFYDIRTTAEFDVATVCLTYDDTGLNVNQEAKLSLQHYVCTNPTTNTGCAWEDITSAGYPDTDTNEICGITDSFSIFALLLPLDDDGDGIDNAEDNCPAVSNADQLDLDSDGLGDVCDSDLDGDGKDDTADNCPEVANAEQTDTDADELGDACDPDIDGDSVANEEDNCPLHANQSQADFDSDGLGDACDPDSDNDGVDNGQDACPGTSAMALVSDNGCSSGQLLELVCPSDGEYRNHGQYVQCIAHEAEQQVKDGLISDEEKDAIVGAAAESDIGKK